jgi:hypothetical protein
MTSSFRIDEWNTMTFPQLKQEARVLGLLGPFEEHQHTEWKLRIMLACEARAIENEQAAASKGAACPSTSTS